jgi:methylenetetrahydrofolate--tRNA-(uracil-5-)-methyltransferase
LFFAGQITGVEGYFESTCIGMLVAHFIDRKVRALPFHPPSRASAMGSLLNAITDETRADHFQPTNINFGMLPQIDGRMPKLEKRALQAEIAKKAFLGWMEEEELEPAITSALEDASQDLIEATRMRQLESETVPAL